MENIKNNSILEILEFLDNNDYITNYDYDKYKTKLENLQNNIDMIVSLLDSPHKEKFKYLTTWCEKEDE